MSALKRVGFFRELKHGKADGPSLHESVRSSASPDAKKIAAYLRGGTMLVVSPGLVKDILAGDQIIGTLAILTDGIYAWPSDLATYVEKHNAALPDEFVAHVVRRRFVPAGSVDVSEMYLD